MEATLSPPIAAARPIGRARWAGRVLSGLAVAFLTFDAALKLAGHPAVDEASQRLGLPVELGPVIGALLLACVVAHVVPRTAVLGAVLLTGYLGGAVLTHLRIGDPLLGYTLFPVYVGALVWGGLWLRDPRARALFADASSTHETERK